VEEKYVFMYSTPVKDKNWCRYRKIMPFVSPWIMHFLYRIANIMLKATGKRKCECIVTKNCSSWQETMDFDLKMNHKIFCLSKFLLYCVRNLKNLECYFLIFIISSTEMLYAAYGVKSALFWLIIILVGSLTTSHALVNV
jgi:hypothetical protein